MPVQEKSRESKLSSGNQGVTSQPKNEGDQEDFSVLASEVFSSVKKYGSHRPAVVAGTLFAIGFILGWKLKPW